MTNRLYLLTILVICYSCGSIKTTNNKEPNYNAIVEQNNSYFKDYLNNPNDSLLKYKKIQYKYFIKWKNDWKGKVDSNGSFEPYYKSRLKIKTSNEKNIRGANSRNDDWRELGPLVTPSGELSSNGGQKPGGGPIEFIEFFEPSPNIILVGSGAGGLFESTNGGNSWRNIGSDTQWLDSGCPWAQYHPTNRNIIFGINNTGHNDSGYTGYTGGLMRTLDAGNKWEQIGNHNNFNGIWNKIKRFAINPMNPNELFVATCDGLFKTSNALEANPALVSWTIVNVDGFIYDLEYMPNSNRLIITTATDNNSNSSDCTYFEDHQNQYTWNLKYTDNGGVNWNSINGNNKPLLNNLQSLTFENSNANTDIIYIQSVSHISSQASLYKYTFSSDDWSYQSNIGQVAMGGGHGFGVSDIDENKIAVACCGMNTDRYKTSSDGGLSWYYPNLINRYQYHVDIEDFEYHPSTNNLFMGSHGGIYVSNNNGNQWIDRNVDLGVTTISGFSSSKKDPSFMVAGLYHGGTIRTFLSPYYSNWIPNWESVYFGDGDHTLVDDNYVYTTWQLEVVRSSNYGVLNSFVNINPNFVDAGNNMRVFDFGQNFVLNHKRKNILYMNGLRLQGSSFLGVDVLRSFNRGDVNTWEAISNFSLHSLNPTKYFVWKIIAAPSDENILYAIVEMETSSGVLKQIYKTTNANTTTPSAVVWNEIQHPVNQYIADLVVDYFNPNTIYIAYTNNFNQPNSLVYKLHQSSWENLDPNNNLMNVSSNKIQIEKIVNGRVYLSTNLGVYLRNELNNTWSLFGSNLPHTRISGMEINHIVGKLRASTFGRGVWEINIECPTEIDLIETGVYSVDTFKEVVNNINSTAQINNSRRVNYRAGNEINLVNGFNVEVGAEFMAVIIPCED